MPALEEAKSLQADWKVSWSQTNAEQEGNEERSQKFRNWDGTRIATSGRGREGTGSDWALSSCVEVQGLLMGNKGKCAQ